MANVVYDNLVYVVSYENEVLVEGYNGFRLEENSEGTCFVIYKEIVDGRDVERRFVLPDDSVDNFIGMAKKFTDFFERQKRLFGLMIEAERLLDKKEEEVLRAVCNGIYQVPENYVGFVAMNLTKTQFFSYAKERILSPLAA